MSKVRFGEVRSAAQGCSGHRWGKSQGLAQAWLTAETLFHGTSVFFTGEHNHKSDTEQGPVGLLGTKSFCVPRFFDYRKQPSFSLHDLP